MNTYWTLSLLPLLFGSFETSTPLSPADSLCLPTYQMDAVIVVAERSPTVLREAFAASSILTGESIRELPVTDLAGALSFVPGMTVIDLDGSGTRPIFAVRGFFGGGKTEYVLLTIDGRPANDLRTGLIDWNQIPLNQIERIEVLRGQGSAEYGDAALAAVVNVVTKRPSDTGSLSTWFSGGQLGERRGDIVFDRVWGRHQLNLGLSGSRGNGFRAHSTWNRILLAGREQVRLRTLGRAYLESRFQNSETHNPGPLTNEQIGMDRLQSSSLFARDYQHRQQLDVGFGLETPENGENHYRADFRLNYLGQKGIETLQLAPQFGDTRQRTERGLTMWSCVRHTRNVGRMKMLVGAEAELGEFRAEYSTVGTAERTSDEGKGELRKGALFSEARLRVLESMKIHVGLRYDWIAAHHSVQAAHLPESQATFGKLSPRFGVNLAYSEKAGYEGHLYANWTSGFRAPSLEQLFDQRQIPVGPPGGYVNFSNELLRPQRSRGTEAGFLQKLTTVRYRMSSEFALTYYQINLQDEIDFDLQTLKYANIQASRHTGVEFSGTIYVLPKFTLSTTLDRSVVKHTGGTYNGHRLKNIPNGSVHNYVSITFGNHSSLLLSHNYIGFSFLDDGNTATLPGYRTFDVKLQTAVGRMSAYLTVKNVLDKRYNSTGYMLFDPLSQSDVEYLYPARGRYVEAGIGIITL